MEGRIMTQNAPEQTLTYSQEEVKAAESAEQAALSKSQNQYLTQRVVVLRAQLDRANRELAELREVHQYCSDPDGEKEPGETPESDPENSPEG
jgi:tRNA splicing endonuclease